MHSQKASSRNMLLGKIPADQSQETLLQMRGETLLPEVEQLRREFFQSKKPSQANLSDGRSPDSDSTLKGKEMDMLEFEPWPHVTRFKNWKTSFRREVTVGFAHPRQATEWLAEIDHAESMLDLDDVESVSGSNRMSFEILDSQVAQDLMKIMTLELRRKLCKTIRVSPC